MEIFTIQVNGILLTVFIQFNGSYSVFTNQYKLCDLKLKYDHNGIWWKTEDLITSEYANDIGKAIEKHLFKKSRYARLKVYLRKKQ